MSSPSIICVAIVVLLSTAAFDTANAKGTFRLAGPWPSSTALNQANQTAERPLQQLARAARHHHRH
jgi:hypothetical protein